MPHPGGTSVLRPSEVITRDTVASRALVLQSQLHVLPLAVAAHHHQPPASGTSPLPCLPVSFPTVLLSCLQASSALPPRCWPSFLLCGHSGLPWVDLKVQSGSQKPLLSPEAELLPHSNPLLLSPGSQLWAQIVSLKALHLPQTNVSRPRSSGPTMP